MTAGKRFTVTLESEQDHRVSARIRIILKPLGRIFGFLKIICIVNDGVYALGAGFPSPRHTFQSSMPVVLHSLTGNHASGGHRAPT